MLFVFNGGPWVLTENREMKKKLIELKNHKELKYGNQLADEKDDGSASAGSNASRRKVLGPSHLGIDGKVSSKNKDGFKAINE